MTPCVSIIIPVCNSARYLRECMDSVVNQSLENIEIICVINGSTDESAAILAEYGSNDSRIIIINLPTPDIGAARNTGVRKADGDYLMFVDSDDMIVPDACEVMYNTAVEHDLEILQGRYTRGPGVRNSFKVKKRLYGKVLSGRDFWKENKNISPVVWDKIWKTGFFMEKELFNSENVYYEDAKTSIEGFLSATHFMLLNKTVYYYRLTEGSITNIKFSEKHVKDFKSMVEMIKTMIEIQKPQNLLFMEPFYIKTSFVYHTIYNKNSIQIFKKQHRLSDISKAFYYPLKVSLSCLFPDLASTIYKFLKKFQKRLAM